MDPSAPRHSDSSSLLEHLETLYPLACTLVGPEDAPHLLRRMAEDTAETPSTDRPADMEGWLRRLLQTARDGQAPSEAAVQSSTADETKPPDGWRRDAAEQIIEAALPVALARCTPQERFLLALDGLDAVSASSPAEALGDVADTTGLEVRATLWTILEDILSDTEYELVDETLSEEAFQDAVDDLLATRYPTAVPQSLRARLREPLQSPATADEETAPSDDSKSLLDRLPPRPEPRALLFALLIGTLVLAGGIGVSYYTESSSSPSTPSQSLVAVSAERASSVTPMLETNRRSEAAAFVDSVWGRRVTVPAIDEAELEGVGQFRATDDTKTPVFLHTDGTTRFTTFVYSYALLSQIESDVTLSPELRDALGTAHRVVDADGETSGRTLLWRDRDDVFVTVAPSLPPDSLRARLRPQG
ncbi:MAG: hypothetical protein BRD41_02390 [Bacteroidetes bacterium QS_1_63_11]|nr:MAG: hypothetical protein BRD41_02390 [Bacteroidetes bacterium QS_1_63_11]